MQLLAIADIVALLKAQGEGRAPENDIGGILIETAERLDREVRELEGEPDGSGR